ncbi:MAG: SopA-like catalytic domain [Solimicrobium sp.]|jgi:hypothetical protein|nr:SopA-like catalytic domain [Solimicrobium sp.]
MWKYAAALMAKTYDLAPEIFGNSHCTSAVNFASWMQKLLGRKDANSKSVFSCSAVLPGEMLRHAKEEREFNDISGWHKTACKVNDCFTLEHKNMRKEN